ncbi:MAG: O-methyltransferase [Labilithrix sp.]|nr:O-methyltransferase [Labilithrix sp.]MCW5835057.1 O-methyltransferase [Labilithrix sp.]
MKDASDAILRHEQAAYLEGIEPARDPLLAEMETWAKDHGQPISDPEVASFLAVTARLSGARSIVEVGTNIGYGAIVLARAAGPDARVVTIENDAETVGVARGFIARAGLSSRIEVRQADALAELAVLTDPIDLVYVDCVKEHYPAYLDLVLPKLSERGVIVADNVLWKGLVAAADVPAHEVGRVQALRTFNHAIVTDSRLRGVVLPLGDGVAYAVRV